MREGNDFQKVRKLPAIFITAGFVFLYVLNILRGGSPVFARLGELTLTMMLLLVVIAWVDVFLNFVNRDTGETLDGETEEAEAPEEKTENPDGLIEIKKDTPTEEAAGRNYSAIVYSAIYLVLIAGIIVWHIIIIFTVPPSAPSYYDYGIADAVLILVFPVIAAIYLKLRKGNGSRPGDKTSQDILTLFFWYALINAAVIAAASVLGIEILIVLQWLFYAVSAYFTVALVFNVILSILKKDVLGDFNYTFIPRLKKRGDLLDSEELKVNLSLKSLYTIKYTLKVLPGLVLALGLILFLSTSVFVVRPHQQAVVYRFGRLGESSVVGEGLHFKLPWPIDRVDIYDVHRVNSMQIGFVSTAGFDNLWTLDHDGGEHILLLGSGNELVAVNMTVVYRISDLFAYVTTSSNPEAVLSAAAYESLLRRTSYTTLDAFLSVDRNLLAVSMQEELAEFSRGQRLGLEVVQVNIESIHPPVEVADVYQRVVTASLERNTIITNAQTHAERILLDAQRQSTTVVDFATAWQYRRTGDAQREMAVFYAAMESYHVNPSGFRLIRQLDTFERVVRAATVYVFSPDMEDYISNTILGGQGTVSPWMR